MLLSTSNKTLGCRGVFLSPMLESQRKNSIFQKDIIQIPVGNLFLQPSAVFAALLFSNTTTVV